MDADRDAVLRRLLERAEVRGDGLARHLRELGNVRFLAKSRARLIERNVAALTQTEDHQIEPPGCLNGGVVVRRVLGIRVRVRGVHSRKRLCRRERRKRRADRVAPLPAAPQYSHA